MKHLTDEQLAEYVYGESCDENEIDTHVNSCSMCRARLDEVKKLSAQLDRSGYQKPQLELDVARVFEQRESALDADNLDRPPLPNGASNSMSWNLSWTLATMAVLAIAGFFAGDFYRATQTEIQFESLVAQRVQATVERYLTESNASPEHDSEFRQQMAVAFQQLIDEQSRINRELQALATNTDNAFQLTRATTNKNARALALLQQNGHGLEFSP